MAKKRKVKPSSNIKRRSLITNNHQSTPQKIIANFTGLTRNETMEGKNFLVAPMIMVVEGVLEGNEGPLYYPASELSKTPAVWNMKPVVVDHPQMNGYGISACDPDIIKNRGVGLIMNATFETNKLKAEAWIDIDKAAIVDNRIVEAIENKTVMELSTGLFTDNESCEGEFNGTSYKGIARNYRPDHLALLPDTKGACSIEDGAGFLRLNVSNEGTSVEIDLKDTDITLEGMNWLAKNSKITTRRLAELIENELSHSDIWSLLSSLLRKDNDDLWIDEVFDTFFIYQDDGVLYKQNYSVNDSKATFIGSREKVFKLIVFKTENGDIVGNDIRKENKMDPKEKLVNDLIANEATQWKEEDEASLLEMNEEMLTKLTPIEKAVENNVTDNATNQDEEGTAAENKEKTAEEYIADAPPAVANMLSNGMASYKADKDKLIVAITANEKNTFTKEQLEAKDLPELKSLAALATNKQKTVPIIPNLNFAGQLEAADVTNEKEEPLAVPSMNYEKKEAAVA